MSYTNKIKYSFFIIPLLIYQSFAGFVEKIDSILAAPHLKNTDIGIEIFSKNKNKIIYSKNANKLFTPASCMKIITSLVALSILKPEYAFKTEIYYSDGNLYIKGYGDPTISTPDLEDIADSIIAKGITEINNIIYDDFYFDKIGEAKGWIIKENAPPYGAKVSALSLNCNCVNVYVYPENETGRTKFVLTPNTSFIKVINNSKIGNKNLLYIERKFIDDKNYIFIGGEIKKNSPGLGESKNVENPSLYTITVFKEILEKKGMKIKGKIKNEEVPLLYTPIFISLSQPLYQIIYDMNKKSINIYADQLLKTLGAEVFGRPGTFEKGSLVLTDFLIKEVGLSLDEFSIYDGSGLSYKNKISPHAMVKILIYAKNNFELFPEFVSSLAIGGIDGTLKKRFKNKKSLRRIRAKTGTLKNISSLSGYANSLNDDLIIFSIMINNYNSSGSMKALENKIIELILTEL